jgi:hypothetical protein
MTPTDRLVLKTRKSANGCIEWLGSRNAWGYGLIGIAIAADYGITRFNVTDIARGKSCSKPQPAKELP